MERTCYDTEHEYIRDCVAEELTSRWEEDTVDAVADLLLASEAHAKEDHYPAISSFPTSEDLKNRLRHVDSSREMASAVRDLGQICLNEDNTPSSEWARSGKPSVNYNTESIIQSAAEGIEAYEPPEEIDF